jgi:DNA ligase-associated metallophosphoesterase
MMPITVHTNIQFQLLAQRAVFWPAQAAIFVADVHIGRPLSYQQNPARVLVDVLTRLSQLIDATQARKLFFLGDLFHMRKQYSAEYIDPFTLWRHRYAHVECTLVRGNHERAMGDPPARCGLQCVNPGQYVADVALLHEPRKPYGFAMMGHLHPSILVSSARATAVAAPCFIWHPNYLVLPAFEDIMPGRIVAHQPHEERAFIRDSEVVACNP